MRDLRMFQRTCKARRPGCRMVKRWQCNCDGMALSVGKVIAVSVGRTYRLQLVDCMRLSSTFQLSYTANGFDLHHRRVKTHANVGQSA
jgi:hypothetical protein